MLLTLSYQNILETGRWAQFWLVMLHCVKWRQVKRMKCWTGVRFLLPSWVWLRVFLCHSISASNSELAFVSSFSADSKTDVESQFFSLSLMVCRDSQIHRSWSFISSAAHWGRMFLGPPQLGFYPHATLWAKWGHWNFHGCSFVKLSQFQGSKCKGHMSVLCEKIPALLCIILPGVASDWSL